jgi:glycosyltransferase involved in cell wall biosynthesis
MPDGQAWPRLSIITPSYNQAIYLEETIRSVLLQGYPDLEYIVIDGSSTDGSLEIIKRYESWLAYWVREPDHGQAEAINKGFARMTGSIATWISSDDFYYPDAWQASVFHLKSTPGCVLTYNDCYYVNEHSQVVDVWKTYQHPKSDLLVAENNIPQPTVFMDAQALRSAGGLDCRFHNILDFDLWVRLCIIGELHYVPGFSASYRIHPASLTLSRPVNIINEHFTWLDKSPYLAGIQTDWQRSEAFRRIHIKAALKYIYIGDIQQAGHHLQKALEGGVYPFGSIDKLAERLCYAKSYQERLSLEAPDKNLVMQKALNQVIPHRIGRQIWKRVISYRHIQSLFQLYRTQPEQSRVHFLKGVYNHPGWLRNRGVLSVGVEVFLGRPFADRLRRLC